MHAAFQFDECRAIAPRPAAGRRGLTLLELVMVVSILAILTALVVPGMTDQQEITRVAVAKASVQEIRDVIANRYSQDMADPMNTHGLPRPHMLLGATTLIDTARETAINASSAAAPQLKYIPQLQYLFVNPRQFDASATPRYAAVKDYDASTRLGWNGPYVMSKTSTYPTPGDPRFPNDPNETRTWAQFGFTQAYGMPGDLTVADPWGSPIVVSVLSQAHGAGTQLLYTAYVVSAGPNKMLDMANWNFTTNADGSLNTGDDIALPIKSWKDVP